MTSKQFKFIQHIVGGTTLIVLFVSMIYLAITHWPVIIFVFVLLFVVVAIAFCTICAAVSLGDVIDWLCKRK